MALTFEWDARKAARNLAKHGVAFDEALTVFADPLARLESILLIPNVTQAPPRR